MGACAVCRRGCRRNGALKNYVRISRRLSEAGIARRDFQATVASNTGLILDTEARQIYGRDVVYARTVGVCNGGTDLEAACLAGVRDNKVPDRDRSGSTEINNTISHHGAAACGDR